MAGQGMAAVFGLGTFMLLARLVSPEVLGDFLLYLSLSTFLEMIRLGVLHTAVVRGLQSEPAKIAPLIGSAWVLALLITLALIIAVAFVAPLLQDSTGFRLFTDWYWLSSLALLPYDFGLWKLQATGRFASLMLLRLINLGGFLCFVSLGLSFSWSSEHLVLGHILSSALASLWAVLSAVSGLRHFFQFRFQAIRQIWSFGRFSMGTFLGTALLKTADTVLIGWFLGSSSVAIYGLASKALEALEVPLRAVVAVALPKLSEEAAKGNMAFFNSLFYRYSGWLSLAFIPLLMSLYFLAPWLLTLIGGGQYGQESVQVFRFLCLFGLLLPTDRLVGISLDALGKPSLNMMKVLVMTSVNIIGDCLVLWADGGVLAVALITVLNIGVGVAIGLFQLNKEIGINFLDWVSAISSHGRYLWLRSKAIPEWRRGL